MLRHLIAAEGGGERVRERERRPAVWQTEKRGKVGCKGIRKRCSVTSTMAFAELRRHGYKRLHARLLRNVQSYTTAFSIISAVSYLGVLRPPRPLGEDTPTAVGSMPSRLSELQAFFFCFNSFAFLSAMSGLLLTTGTALSPDVLPSSGASSCPGQAAATQMKRLAATMPKAVGAGALLAVSTTSCGAAILFAGLSRAMGRAGLSLALPLIVPSAIGMFVLLQAVWILGRDGAKFWMQVREVDEELWAAMKEGSVVGRLLTTCSELLQPSTGHKV